MSFKTAEDRHTISCATKRILSDQKILDKQGCAVPLYAPYPPPTHSSQHNLLEEEACSPAGPSQRRKNRNDCTRTLIPCLERMGPGFLFELTLTCCRHAATRIAPLLQPQARSSLLKKHDPLSGSHQNSCLTSPSTSSTTNPLVFKVRSPSAVIHLPPISHMQKDAHLAHSICFKE